MVIPVGQRQDTATIEGVTRQYTPGGEVVAPLRSGVLRTLPQSRACRARVSLLRLQFGGVTMRVADLRRNRNPRGDMRIFRKAKRNREETVTLPDGRQITLDRDWSEYTIEELAALGITPGMGGGAAVVVRVIPRDPRWTRRVRPLRLKRR